MMMSATALAVVMMVSTLAVTMTATTFVIAIVMVVSTLAVAVTAATFVFAIVIMIVVAATSAGLFAHAIEHAFDFGIGGLAVFNDSAFKIKFTTGKRMVKVDNHIVIGDIKNQAEETVAILILQRHDSVFVNIVVVEMTVYRKYTFLQSEHSVLLVLTVGLIACEMEIKCPTLFNVVHLVFKLIESDTESGNELERFVGGSLFDHLCITVRDSIQFVGNSHILILFLVHNSD